MGTEVDCRKNRSPISPLCLPGDIQRVQLTSSPLLTLFLLFPVTPRPLSVIIRHACSQPLQPSTHCAKMHEKGGGTRGDPGEAGAAPSRRGYTAKLSDSDFRVEGAARERFERGS